MRKIVCNCGEASFTERLALYDATEKEISANTQLVKNYYKYVCDKCGAEWHQDEIEIMVIGNIDPETNKPINEREIILDRLILEEIRMRGVASKGSEDVGEIGDNATE